MILICYICHINIKNQSTMMENDIHWIKVVPADKKKNNEWLAEHWRKDSATVSSQGAKSGNYLL